MTVDEHRATFRASRTRLMWQNTPVEDITDRDALLCVIYDFHRMLEQERSISRIDREMDKVFALVGR